MGTHTIIFDLGDEAYQEYLKKRGKKTHSQTILPALGIQDELKTIGRPRNVVDELSDSLTAKAHAHGDEIGKSLWATGFRETAELKRANDAADAEAKRSRGK